MSATWFPTIAGNQRVCSMQAAIGPTQAGAAAMTLYFDMSRPAFFPALIASPMNQRQSPGSAI